MKNIFKLVSPLVKKINKQVLNRGLFSESLKNALVVPIFKTGDRNNFTNYRPISILPVFSKVFEKNVHKQVQSYLEFFDFFDSSQFRSFDFFLYFAKAFECVHYEILLKKMSCHGIREVALKWFKSYSIDRNEIISLIGYNPQLSTNKSGYL